MLHNEEKYIYLQRDYFSIYLKEQEKPAFLFSKKTS